MALIDKVEQNERLFFSCVTFDSSMRHTKLTLHLQIIKIKSMKETNPLISQTQLFFQTNEDNEGREPEISIGEREEKIERESGTFFPVRERVSIN